MAPSRRRSPRESAIPPASAPPSGAWKGRREQSRRRRERSPVRCGEAAAAPCHRSQLRGRPTPSTSEKSPMEAREKAPLPFAAAIAAFALVLATDADAQWSASRSASAAPDVCPPGGRCVDARQPLQVAPAAIPPATLGPGGFLVFPNTRVAANGVGLRDVASGGIDLVGIPPGSTVVAAYLYWCWISLNAPLPG